MVQRFSVCVATILISLIMLTITGVAAVGGRSTVTVSFYAGQRTQQQIDNRNVKIPNGTDQAISCGDRKDVDKTKGVLSIATD